MTKSPRSRRIDSLLIAGLAVAALAIVGFLSLRSWISLGDVDISTNGWIAIILGVVVTLAVGGGLMALVFYSSRKHYDDASR
jgi:TRAP-type C4-dicarboxylate transport system permease small subunit